MTIDDFIKELSEYEGGDTVFNMYYGSSEKAVSCRKRLKEYLEGHKDAQILLVGEAPGYNGCAKTGVPFTSDSGEPSSKAIQEYLVKVHQERLDLLKKYGRIDELSTEADSDSSNVLIWNAFPFHPHKKDNKESNRKPSASELAIGQRYLEGLLEVFPNLVCFGAIGKTAEKVLGKMDLYYRPSPIRHPAYGGRKKCEEDLQLAFGRFCQILLDERIMRSVAEAAEDPEAAYRYLQDHKEDFFDWWRESDHLEYGYAYWQIFKIDLSEYERKGK